MFLRVSCEGLLGQVSSYSFGPPARGVTQEIIQQHIRDEDMNNDVFSDKINLSPTKSSCEQPASKNTAAVQCSSLSESCFTV